MNPPKQALLLGCLLAAAVCVPARAYVLEGVQWPANTSIVLGLQLGSPQGALIDGSTSWDEVFKDATAIWNPYLDSGVQLVTATTNVTPAQNDGHNTIFFSPTFFGESFGDDTLATTAYLYHPSTHLTYEADIGFNSAKPYNSYRGNLRISAAGSVYDLRRVALHELGHVLGLAHVPQSAQAIMTPVTTDLDTIQADDIAGVESLYGNPAPAAPVIHGDLGTGGLVGDPFTYQITAANQPTGFSAIGLPPGLSIDTASGLISGTPATAGTYNVTINATNTAGTGQATLDLVFSQTPKITGTRDFTAYLGRVFYDQITTTGMATGFLFLNGGLPPGLTLDPATGLLSGTPTQVGDFSFQAEANNAVGSDEEIFGVTVDYDATLTVVAISSFGTDALIRAADGNLYGTDGGNTVYRLTPGGNYSKLYTFAPNGPFAPDDLHQAADGSFYGATSAGGTGFAGTVFKLTADGTMTTVGNFPTGVGESYSATNVLLASDGNYYGTLQPYLGAAVPGGVIYKLAPDGTFTLLHQFNGTDGYYPSALIQAGDGNFYGTTYQGGSGNFGTVFRIAPDGTYTILHGFTSGAGAYPLAPLIQAADGNFYGTTSAGGTGDGTVFQMTPDGTLTTLHAFTGADGGLPKAALAQSSDGNFYGSTANEAVALSAGDTNVTLFELTPDGTLTTIHTFTPTEGNPAPLPLVPDGTGNFYGAAVGLTGNLIFKETPTAVPLTYAPPGSSVVPAATLAATAPRATVGGAAGVVTATLSAAQATAVKVHYVVKGSAINGTDYLSLSGTIKFKPGQTSKNLTIVPAGNLEGAASKKLKLALTPGNGYTVGTLAPVKIKILPGG